MATTKVTASVPHRVIIPVAVDDCQGCEPPGAGALRPYCWRTAHTVIYMNRTAGRPEGNHGFTASLNKGSVLASDCRKRDVDNIVSTSYRISS